jgi:hypothetical protein
MPQGFISEGSEKKPSKRGKHRHPNSLKNLRPYTKGTSGNLGGLPGTDLAAVYARRLFERHPEGISEELGRELKGFNAYAFSVLADRRYGKVKEHQRVEHTGADDMPLGITIKIVESDGSTRD